VKSSSGSIRLFQGKGVDLLFGLDMLKRYTACIDLAKNALVIQGREVRFLSEHELPHEEEEVEVDACVWLTSPSHTY
jgi:DNA damage-inducible protein 1